MADDDEMLKLGTEPDEDTETEEPEELEGMEVEETEDGGAVMTIEAEEETVDPEFYDNLAESLPITALQQIALGLVEDVKRDQEDREERDQQYEEGIRRTGLGNDAPGGAQFQGASRVVHPMLTEACVDFAARAMKELFPSAGQDGGPVKAQIIGKPTKEKVEKANRKARHLNWQVTKQMKGFRSELEQLLSQVPLAGAQYLKLVWDRRLKRPKPLFVPLDDVFLPYSATSFRTAERKTHRQTITDLEFVRRVATGMYRDVPVPTSQAEELSAPAQANEKIEGKASSSMNEDGLRTIYEVYCNLEIEDDDEAAGEIAPYVISIDSQTNVVLSLYRNWDPRDDVREELPWMVEFPFVPWRGAYPIGITHMIGGLSAATTGALRALLDSAFLQNNPAGVKLKGGSIGGQNISVQPGNTAEIQGTPNAVDIRQTYMPLPYQGPSPVLFELLGFLINSGKGVVQTTFEKLADQPANQPVGTTVALIEQGMVVFSEIHARLHHAMGETLSILHRLNQTYLEDDELFDDVGELLAKREDYQGPMDVAPVSDPNIFSETQRMAQVQMVAGRAQLRPDLYDGRKVEELILERTKIPDAKDLLLPRPEPQKLNAVNENLAATMGRPIIAFPDQDHLAHLQVHIDYMMSPMFGMNPLIAPGFISGMLNHVKDHIAYWYVDSFVKFTSQAAGVDITKLMDNEDEEVGQEFDRMLAAASPTIIEIAMQELSKLPPIIQQAMQVAQQFAPPQMGDPTQAAMMAAQATVKEVERKAQADQIKGQLDQQRLQMDNQRLQIEGMGIQMKQQEMAFKQQLEQSRTEMEQRNADAERAAKMMLADKAEQVKLSVSEQATRAKMETNTSDNQTALTIAQMEIESGREARQEGMAFDAQMAEQDRQIDQQNAAADRAFNAQQAAEDRRHGIETTQVDRMFQAVDKQTEREHRSEQADKDREFKGTKVGVSTGTGINPNPKK
jgi:hypothetical protein